MKRKINGFTMIELLVGMAIIAMMVAMAVPNFTRMAQEFNFDRESREVFDLFSEVRAKALSYKKCDNQETAKQWLLEIDESNDTFEAKCVDVNDVEQTVSSIDFDPSKTRSRLIKLTGSNDQAGLDSVSAPSINTPVTITYYPGRAQATPKSGSTVHNFLKLELEYFGTSMNKSICLSRIAGFSLLNNIDNQCSNVF